MTDKPIDIRNFPDITRGNPRFVMSPLDRWLVQDRLPLDPGRDIRHNARLETKTPATGYHLGYLR